MSTTIAKLSPISVRNSLRLYESRGIIEEFEDESDDSVVDIDLSEIVEYIIKNAKKDQIGSFTEEEVLSIVEAEMDFCGFEEEQEEA